MFKFYLSLNNESSYGGYYELHKKSCPIVKQMLDSDDDYLLAIGYYPNSTEALLGAKEALVERALDPNKLNGCLACNKECHKRL